MNMKIILCIVTLFSISYCIYAAADDAKGYLVIEVERHTSNAEKPTDHSGIIAQSFKIPLSSAFLSQFKHVPSQNSAGTGFCCSGGALKGDGDTAFVWWIRKTVDNRWSINMWGQGSETVGNVKLQSRDPVTSDYLTIRHWEDLDMNYQISYDNMPNGLGVTFSAKYVTAEDKKALDAIPEVGVKKSDGFLLFKGDDLSKCPLEIHCSFQEG